MPSLRHLQECVELLVDGIKASVVRRETGFDPLEPCVDRSESRVDRVESRVDRVESRVDFSFEPSHVGLIGLRAKPPIEMMFELTDRHTLKAPNHSIVICEHDADLDACDSFKKIVAAAEWVADSAI